MAHAQRMLLLCWHGYALNCALIMAHRLREGENDDQARSVDDDGHISIVSHTQQPVVHTVKHAMLCILCVHSVTEGRTGPGIRQSTNNTNTVRHKPLIAETVKTELLHSFS